jgi:cysteine-rich repeat protein
MSRLRHLLRRSPSGRGIGHPCREGRPRRSDVRREAYRAEVHGAVVVLFGAAVTLSTFARVSAAAAVTGAAAGTPPAVSERPAPSAIDRFGRFEVGVDVAPRPVNPFDPLEMAVQLVLRDPQRRTTTVDAYWFQDFDRSLDARNREVLTPRDAPYWKAAYAPTKPGLWLWRWEVTTPAARQVGDWHSLDVSDRAAGHGFLHVSARDARYLVYDDGTPYFAIGENVSCYDRRGTYTYDDVMDKLAARGETWIRVWMPACGMGIETADTGLGDYTNRLDHAWQLDHVLEAAAERGIAVQLVLLYHGELSTQINPTWDTNPYNAANGGPLATPKEFFTDPVARRFFAQRLRYIVARYGAYTSLEAWELWNEVDLTDGYDSATVAAWHQTMVALLRTIDAAHHPVTTSFAYFFNDPAVVEGAALDLVQQHFYSRSEFLSLFPDLAQVAVQFPRDRVAQYGRPALFAEIGVGSGADETLALDPEGIAVHDGLWAGPFGEAMGTGMPWWWRLVIDADPDRYYPMFGSVASFLRDVPWDREGFVASDPPVTTASGRAVRAHALVGDDLALLWVKDGDVRYYAPERVDVADARVALDALPGRWCAVWWDTWSGSWLQAAPVEGGPGRTLAVPPFAADTAVRLGRGPRCACEPECRPVCGDGRVGGSEQCDDGNTTDGDGCDATCHLEPEGVVIDGAAAPFSATTDTEGDGAIASDFIETTVTSPLPGRVTIDEGPRTAGTPSWFGFVTGAVEIAAPVASVQDPLRIDFLLDGSLAPFVGDVVWLRDGIPVPACSGSFGEASPDPCVWSSTHDGDDLHATLLTSTAGTWQAVRPLCDGGSVLAARPKIVATRVLTSREDDRLAVTADLTLPYPFEPPLAPQTYGFRLIVAGVTGTLLDQTLPGGEYADPPKAGWRTKARSGGTEWRYLDRAASPGTVTKAVVRDGWVRTPGLVRIVVRTAPGTLAGYPSTAPLGAAFVLDALAGQCGHLEFPGLPAPHCAFNAKGTTFVCR